VAHPEPVSIPPIVLTIPSRGRSQFLPSLLGKLAATKSDRSTIVVVSNGPEAFPDPGLEGIYVVHIGDVPTLGVAVNFGWYALASPGCILAKVDNDIDPPDDWEREIVDSSNVVSLGGFLNRADAPTPLVSIAGRTMRRAHWSENWGMPFVFGGFVWLAPTLAERLQYHDERFIRSTDGDLGERTSRIPGAIAAYSAEQMYDHRYPMYEASTESAAMVGEMYQASDRLIKVLPPREITEPTIWQDCLSREAAAHLVHSKGTLPATTEEQARELLRRKLEAAYAPIGYGALIERILQRH
jgi:hypothetical protein